MNKKPISRLLFAWRVVLWAGVFLSPCILFLAFNHGYHPQAKSYLNLSSYDMGMILAVLVFLVTVSILSMHYLCPRLSYGVHLFRFRTYLRDAWREHRESRLLSRVLRTFWECARRMLKEEYEWQVTRRLKKWNVARAQRKHQRALRAAVDAVQCGSGDVRMQDLQALAYALGGFWSAREVVRFADVRWDSLTVFIASRLERNGKFDGVQKAYRETPVCEDFGRPRKWGPDYLAREREFAFAHPDKPVPDELDPEIVQEKHLGVLVRMLQAAGYPVTFAGAGR